MFISSVVLFAYADNKDDNITIVDIINADSSSKIKISQPQGLNNRILEISDVQVDDKDVQDAQFKPVISTGKQLCYRILAFNKANQRKQAVDLSQKINSKFPQYGAKVSSNLPYWQVWVGTFFNEDDARKAQRELRRAFPGNTMTIRKKNIVVVQ